MKSMIVYASHHHGNTEKLVKGLAEKYDIDLIDAEKATEINYDEYDIIGFASGVDFGKFYAPVTDFAEKLPAEKNIYAIYTCGQDNAKYGGQIQEISQKSNCKFLGKYGCKGYDTYGPWKIIGGINKVHPNQDDIDKACAFYENILKTAENK
ncbi:MAG: flavodoxin [Clostridiales bacterium]|nr:flavodoxin [Clostridiales bacterium]